MLGSGGVYDPDGEDADGDGYGCDIDCDDADAGAFNSPFEVEGAEFLAMNTLQWPSAAATAGDSTTYDIVRGAGSEFPVGSGVSETCAASGYETPPGIGTNMIRFDDDTQPDLGEVFWYLIRATNGCGIGTYGSTSVGDERITMACP